VFATSWPSFDAEKLKKDFVILVVQVNGRVRDQLEVTTGISEEEARKKGLDSERVGKWLTGQEIKKVIFVPDKLVNFVTE